MTILKGTRPPSHSCPENLVQNLKIGTRCHLSLYFWQTFCIDCPAAIGWSTSQQQQKNDVAEKSAEAEESRQDNLVVAFAVVVVVVVVVKMMPEIQQQIRFKGLSIKRNPNLSRNRRQ